MHYAHYVHYVSGNGHGKRKHWHWAGAQRQRWRVWLLSHPGPLKAKAAPEPARGGVATLPFLVIGKDLFKALRAVLCQLLAHYL